MLSPLTLGIVLTVVSAFGFGSGSLFAKPVYAVGVGWPVLMAYRFLVGAALAWAWLLVSRGRRRQLRRLSRRSIVVSAALGVLYTGNSGTYFAGLETVSASLSALIVYIYPAIVAVISLRLGRPLEGWRAWGALALALAGVALAIGVPEGEPPPIAGLLLVAVSPVIYAVWIVLAARLSGERRSGVGEGTDTEAAPMAAGAIMLTATATTYWVGNLAFGLPVLPASIPSEAWFGMIGVGLVSTFIAVQAFYAGAHRLGAARASLVSTVEPIWTIVLANLLFGEVLGPLQLLGGALILGGVVLSQTGPAAAGAARELRVADE